MKSEVSKAKEGQQEGQQERSSKVCRMGMAREHESTRAGLKFAALTYEYIQSSFSTAQLIIFDYAYLYEQANRIISLRFF